MIYFHSQIFFMKTIRKKYGQLVLVKNIIERACKKRTKSATHREMIRPLKTVSIRPPMTEMIRPLSIKSAILY